MRINRLTNQTIAHYSRTGFDRYGREAVGVQSNLIARVQVKTIPRLLPNGEVVEVLAVAYLDLESTGVENVKNGDKVSYDGTDYKVFGLSKVVDANGNLHHYKLELARWQT